MTKKEFGRRLAQARIARGLSQSELGSLANISGMHVSHFECGRRYPSLQNFRALCVALDYQPNWMLFLQ